MRLALLLSTGFAALPGSGATAEREPWSFTVATATYIVPEDADYLQPTLTADRGRFHLEGRFNYESPDTASAWVGCNLAGGDSLTYELAPMMGVVFGESSGVALGYRGSLGFRRIELYSEGEVGGGTGDSSETFAYSWTELSVSPVEAVRAGIVAQRTRLYRAEREVQRGFLVGVTVRALDLGVYVFNPDLPRPTWVVSAGVEF